MSRSIPIYVPREMTVTSIYGAYPGTVVLAEEAQPWIAPVKTIAPTRIEPGWWVVVDGEQLERATPDDLRAAHSTLSAYLAERADA